MARLLRRVTTREVYQVADDEDDLDALDEDAFEVSEDDDEPEEETKPPKRRRRR